MLFNRQTQSLLKAFARLSMRVLMRVLQIGRKRQQLKRQQWSDSNEREKRDMKRGSEGERQRQRESERGERQKERGH